MNGLQVENLKVRRGAFSLEVPSLSVAPGEIVSVCGPSGSGKSTLLEALAGFLALEAGTIRLGKNALDPLPPEKRKIGLVFQRSALFSHLSVGKNIEFGLKVQGRLKAERAREASHWLARVGLAGLENRMPWEISEGQAQRVSLARALAPGFSVLLLDEPFSALDEDTRKELRRLLKTLVQERGICTILVTHQAEDVQALSDKQFRLQNGKLTS